VSANEPEPVAPLLKDENGAPFPDEVQRAWQFGAQVLISNLLVAQLRDEERIAAEAEKRGAIKALRGEADRLHDRGQGGGGTVAHHLYDLARRIESSEVTP
jgi:hypothetical protein